MVQRGIRAGTVLFALLLATILLLIVATTSQGQSSDTPTSSERTAQTNAQQLASADSRLFQKAEREGTVRVIVGLRRDFVPEGRLSRSAVADQRDQIRNARTGLRGDLQGTGYRTLREYETIPYVALELSPQALQAIERSPRVKSIVEDRPFPATLAQSVPKVQAPTVWNSGYTGAGQTIAVLDTGVDSSHPFLAGKVVAEACYTSDRKAGSGDCPNGTSTQVGAGSGVPCSYARPLNGDPTASGCNHGTHVAGIAAGKGTDFSGVAKGANIMAVQVFSRFTGEACRNADGQIYEDPCALSYTSDQVAGLDRVNLLSSTRKFSSVNISIGDDRWSNPCDSTGTGMKFAIDNLRTNDIATVISSGNNGYTNAMNFPACVSSAISVGSTTDADTVSSFSNSASFLSLLAPGSSIYSSLPGGIYRNYNGTSMAAPHVAGAWALLKQKTPSASVDTVLATLKNTGTPVKDTRVSTGVTKPRINIAAAAGHPTVTATVPAPGTRNVVPSTNVKVTFSEAMDPATVNTRSIWLRRDFGNATYSSPLPATVTYYAGGGSPRTAVLNPRDNLVPGGLYVATVFPSNKDLAGNPLAVGKFWRFVVRR